jgi:Na+/proline symporter
MNPSSHRQRRSNLWYLLPLPPFIGLLFPIPIRLGGYKRTFAAAQAALRAHPKPGSIFSTPAGFSAYATLALGSALALFLYPHSVTGILASNRAGALRRNMTLQFAIYLQLLGGVWILQTFPAIVLGLWTRWFHDRALLVGWFVGMVLGTAMAVSQNFSAVFPLHIGATTMPGYTALYALIVNLSVSAVVTLIFDAFHISRHPDTTVAEDYDDHVVVAKERSRLKPAMAAR